MSAETLCRAAALMRERAKSAGLDVPSAPWHATVLDDGRAWLQPHHIGMHGYPSTAEHIASWDPAVALAVADWLVSVADDPNVDFELINSEGCSALAVARAYLGEAS